MKFSDSAPPHARGRMRRRLAWLMACVLTSAGLVALGAGTSTAVAGVTHTQVYIADYGANTVTAYDTATGTVAATVPVGTQPRAAAPNPAGTRVYVPNGGSSTVSVIDTATDAVIGSVAVGTFPVDAVVSPDGTRVYVVNFTSHTVSVISTATDTVVATVSVGANPYGIAVSPDNSEVFVANELSNTVSVISAATNTVVGTIPVGALPIGIVVSPDGSTVYVSNNSNNTVSVISTATLTVTSTLAVGSEPNGEAISADGSTLYLVEGGANALAAINTSTGAITATIPVGTAPQQVALNAAGTSAYVTDYTPGSLSIIDTATNTVSSTLTGLHSPMGLGAPEVPQPVVTGLSPISGPDAGATTVTITGSGFTEASTVDFGTVAAASFTVDSDTQITAVTPAHADGTVDVTVHKTAGTSTTSAADQYTFLAPAPAITGISPTHGPEAGGTTVTITGTDFTGATAVAFGGVAATSFTVVSDTQITAVAPAGSYGTVDVTVTTPSGTSATGSADQYAYVNTLAKLQGAGRIPVGTHAGEFGVSAQRTTTGGTISGHLEFEDQADGVHVHDGTFSDLYLTSATTAYATGTANCTISGVTSTCAFSLTAVDGGKGAGSFTLTYNTTTVGGTILSGHVTVAAASGSGSPAPATPAAATTGTFAATLLGISLSGGQCAAGATVTTAGAATGEVSCLLLGVAGINIDVDLPPTAGATGTGTATLSGTATITVAGTLPVSLPATAVLVASGASAGLQLTVGGVTLPVLPIGTGGIEIG